MLRLDNLRLGGALRWKVENRRLGRLGSVMYKAGTSKVVAPPKSFKNRWVDPREQVLNVPIACRRFGPISPVAGCQQKVCFAPTASMAILGEKLGRNPWIGQPVCYGLCREIFFSGAVALLNFVDDCTNCCYALTVRDTYGQGPYVD
jgi:hypothetical protein